MNIQRKHDSEAVFVTRTPPAILEARGVSVDIGARTLLSGIDIAVMPGRVTALLGPNGAGKSTLLKVLSGILAPTRGDVLLEGLPLAAYTPDACARRRAVLGQDTHLPFAFTVRDVAHMGRYPHAKLGTRARDEVIVNESLADADVLSLRDRVFPTLSGGEKQRTHWARVLSQIAIPPEPRHHAVPARCALLDEPTASLDPGHQHGLLLRARALAAEGAGVLVVLHDLNLAALYADDLAILHDGRVAAAGTPESVLKPTLLKLVYGMDTGVTRHPDNGKPQIYARMASPAPAGERFPGAYAPNHQLTPVSARP